MTISNLVRFAALLALAAGFACSGSPTAPAGSGTLNLRITDAPYSEAQALLVTFSAVQAHRADTDAESWITLPFAEAATGRTCDLKKLVGGAQDILGVGPLEAGHYTQVRLVVSSAALYFDNPSVGEACAPTIAPPDGESSELEIPSGEVKLNRQFEVAEGGATTMLIDFDGDRSVRETGNGRFRMTPVIGVVSVQQTAN